MSLSYVLCPTYHGNQLGELQFEVDGDRLADVCYRSHQLVVV